MDGCKIKSKNSSRVKVGEHIPSRFSMSTTFKTCLQYICKSKENQHEVYQGEDCMEQFCEFLREHTIQIIHFEQRKTRLLTNKI